jgi:hypothetical protein
MFFDKSATKKVLFLNLICNGIQMILTVILGFGLLYFNAKFNLIQTRTAALLLCNFLLFLVAFFLKKFIIKGYSIEKLLHKINEILSPFIRKYSSCRFSLLDFFHINTIFCFDFAVDLPFHPMAAITSIYLVTSYLHFSF